VSPHAWTHGAAPVLAAAHAWMPPRATCRSRLRPSRGMRRRCSWRECPVRTRHAAPCPSHTCKCAIRPPATHTLSPRTHENSRAYTLQTHAQSLRRVHSRHGARRTPDADARHARRLSGGLHGAHAHAHAHRHTNTNLQLNRARLQPKKHYGGTHTHTRGVPADRIPMSRAPEWRKIDGFWGVGSGNPTLRGDFLKIV
jgi:hypothetical protein